MDSSCLPVLTESEKNCTFSLTKSVADDCLIMKKKCIVILLLTGTLNTAFAQISKNYQRKDGPEYEARRGSIQDVLGPTPEGIVIVRQQGKVTYLELLGESGAVTRSSPVNELKYKALDKKYMGGTLLRGKLFLRFTAYDGKKKIAYGLVEEYDLKKLKPIRTVMEEATNLEGAKKIYWYGFGLTRALEELSENGFFVSGEKNYVVDYSSTLSKETKSPETVSMRVYNSSFERVWERDYTLPYANSVFAITEVIVDEAGNTYLVGREYRGKGKPRGGALNYVYHILVFTNNGTQVDDRKIELPGVYVTDLTMGVNARKQVMAVGFYSKTGKELSLIHI